MDKRLIDEGLKAKMLLSVHDELIFEAPEDEIQKLEQIVCDVMEHAVELDVPLKVDVSWGNSWFEAK
jgi:DNA polymerase-1